MSVLRKSWSGNESDIEAGSSRHGDHEDGESSSDPFVIPRTKDAPIERLKRWRVCVL